MDNEEIDSYRTAMGENVTLSVSPSKILYIVDCWDSEDNSRWHKEFDNEEDARSEFDRWRS